MMKSNPRRGVVYNLCRKAVSRSLAIKVAEKSVLQKHGIGYMTDIKKTLPWLIPNITGKAVTAVWWQV